MTAGPSNAGGGGGFAHGVFTACQQSHPFEDRRLPLSHEQTKIGRSVARLRPQTNNAIFDCKVLSRNHAVIWYEDGKFYLRDTKSSNGTFVNNTRLSKGSEESEPKEIFSGDIIQFGVDIIENTKKKVTHGCIVALVRLFHPDATEAIGNNRCESALSVTSSLSNLSCESGQTYVNMYDYNDISATELFQLRQYIREAAYRESMLETKLSQLKQIVESATESSNISWQALIDEERLLSRIESLEAQLAAQSKNLSEDKLREQLTRALEDREKMQIAAKESLRRALEEKVEAVQKLADVERSLETTEETCTKYRQEAEAAGQELDAQQQKHAAVVLRIDELQAQIREAESRYNELETRSHQQQQSTSGAAAAPSAAAGIPDEPTASPESGSSTNAQQLNEYKSLCESLQEQLQEATNRRTSMKHRLERAQGELQQRLAACCSQENTPPTAASLGACVQQVLVPLIDAEASPDEEPSAQLLTLTNTVDEQNMHINNLKEEVQTAKSLRAETEQENEALRKHQMNTELLLSQLRTHSKMVEDQLAAEQGLKSAAYDEHGQVKEALEQAAEENTRLLDDNKMLQEKVLKVTEQLAEYANTSLTNGYAADEQQQQHKAKAGLVNGSDDSHTTSLLHKQAAKNQAEFATMRDECGQLKDRLVDIEGEMKSLRKENTRLLADNRKQKEALDSMLQLKQSLESNEAKWREQADSTATESTIIRNQLNETRRELESMREQRNQFERDLAASKREATPPIAASNYDDLLLQTQTITIASAVPLVLLGVAMLCAWLPFFSWLTATSDDVET